MKLRGLVFAAVCATLLATGIEASASSHRSATPPTMNADIIPVGATRNDLAEPKVFASAGGELNIVMIARPKRVNLAGLAPTAWVYEICLRKDAKGDSCPADNRTSSPYGGVRLALQAGDHLRIKFVNHLPPAPPDAEHVFGDPMGAMLAANPTNLHTHGLIVEPRRATADDPTYGDFVYVLGYPKGKLPLMQDPGLDYTDQPISYDIYIPKNHPSGLFWFHPHAHGLALNQVSEGLAGIITVGSPDDYLSLRGRRGIPQGAKVRHLILKDMQVLSDNTVVDQEDPDLCEHDPSFANRPGFCPGATYTTDDGTVVDYAGAKWIFSINGQVFPTIQVVHGSGEVWRITNTSGSRAYDLQLIDNAGKALPVQVLAIDGVSLDSSAPASIVAARLHGKMNVSSCGDRSNPRAVCATSVKMYPSSRAEIWVSSRQAEKTYSATLVSQMVLTGEDADHWPASKLATVMFHSGRDGARVTDTLTTFGAKGAKEGILSAPVRISDRNIGDEVTVQQASTMSSRQNGKSYEHHLAAATDKWAGRFPACPALPAGHHRRIFFGVPAGTEDGFGLGYEEVDENGNPVAGTFQDIAPFNHSFINVCLPLASGNRPVEELWELINVANEDHNFHIHQTKFRVVLPSPADSNEAGALVDNLPVYNGGPTCDGSIAAWRGGACPVKPVLVKIPFSQLGDFVYHCHILEHEDGGMMAHIRVVPHQ